MYVLDMIKIHLLCMKRHMEAKHKDHLEHESKCSYCGVIFDDDETLAEHSKRHVNRPDFQCVECGFIYKTKCNLRDHMKRVHVSCAAERFVLYTHA